MVESNQGGARPPTALRKAAVMLTAIVLFQLALVGGFLSALDKPALRRLPVAAVGSGGAVEELRTAAGDRLDVRMVTDERAAREEIMHRKVYGAVLLEPGAPRLLVASAAGASPAQALTALFRARARAGGHELVVTDIRPLPRHDAHGLGPTFLVFGWAIGGYLAAMLVGRLLGMRSGTVRHFVLRLAVLLGFAAVSSAATVALVDAGMGILSARPLALVGIGVLTVFGIGCLSSLLQSLFGLAGTLLSVATVVLLGNPTSAGAQTPPEMMPAFWAWAAHVVPNAAARNAVFETEWFGGHGTGTPLTTLALWAAVPILAMILLLVPGVPKGTTAGEAAMTDADLLDAQGTSLAVSGGPI